MKKLRKLWCLTALAATGTFFLAGFHDVAVSANNTPQTLPFSQNWTDTGLITTDDTWTNVPGIVGYRGDDLTIVTGADPRTLLADGSATPVDVNANQTTPDTFTTGGVAEFHIANPTIALNGSGTADAPHVVVYLNTTGRGSINFQCNLRDIDGSVDNAIMQVDVQYRVGGAGSYTSVPGGYFADVTTGGTATQVTPVNVTLPGAANNAALVEVRIMTTNAVGNDEWVGVDDISVTSSPFVPVDAPMDTNGDGKSDYVVVRNTGGGPSGQITWFYSNGTTFGQTNWGIATDFFVMEDFDGDNKDDIAVWRAAAPGASNFYILESVGNTIRIDTFGQSGDDPTIVGDYDGDGKADVAVYRGGAVAGAGSTWFYRGSLTPANITYVLWGQNGDFPSPGDYDGDSKFDYVVQRNAGGGQARFWRRFANGTQDSLIFGTPTDVIVPGDYDGDGKCDIATVRGVSGNIQWHVLSSLNGSITYYTFGLSATDFPAQGDYDGDGRVGPAIWRPNADPTQNFFITYNQVSGAIGFAEWGQNGDYPVNNYNTH